MTGISTRETGPTAVNVHVLWTSLISEKVSRENEKVIKLQTYCYNRYKTQTF